jgi:hypothetical protein
LEIILLLAENGATIMFQAKPTDIPGFQDLESKRERLSKLWKKIGLESKNQVSYGKGKLLLSENIASSLEKEQIYREEITESGLKFIKRKIGHDKYYFVVNHSSEVISQPVNFLTKSENAYLMNPLDGKIGLANSVRKDQYLAIDLHLESGESIIIRTTDQKSDQVSSWNYNIDPTSISEISADWRISFDPNGGPNTPKNQAIRSLATWTDQGDSEADYYSGKGTYHSSFNFDLDTSMNYTLNFSKIYESAKIWINGDYAGQVWSLPYKLDISGMLLQGENQIKIEVANLMANHIRYLDINNISWRNYHEINFVNIDYKPFDSSSWNVMPSGLEGKIEIKGFKN